MHGFALLCVLVLVSATMAPAQDRFAKVNMKAEHVAGNVHMLTGAGGNIGVSAGDDGILFIDDQFAPLADKIRAAIAKIHPGELEFLINTHFHGDHTGSNASFGDEAHIVAHENVRVRLSRGRGDGDTVPSAVLPVITFEDGMSIFFNGERVRITHLPAGHTDGDSYIYFEESKVAHLGDHFFKDRFPFVDVKNGGNAIGLMKNVEKLVETLPEGTKIIPGHGALADGDDLKRYLAMLQSTIDMVRAGKKSGQSLEEIQAAGFDAKYSDWGSGFINATRWAQIIFASI